MRPQTRAFWTWQNLFSFRRLQDGWAQLGPATAEAEGAEVELLRRGPRPRISAFRVEPVAWPLRSCSQDLGL